MTASLRNRRRAERFAQLLDEADGGRRQRVRTDLDDELTELVALRHELVMSRPQVEVDREFRTGLRAMLVATAEREGIGQTATAEQPQQTPVRQRRFVRAPRARTAVLAGVAVGAVTFAGMSTASENTVPGDMLYGVKRSTERAQLALASSDVGRGELYLDFARTRLDEAQSMSGGLDRVLDDMDRETVQGVKLLTGVAAGRTDDAALAAIDGFIDSQLVGLTELAGRVGSDDVVRVQESLYLLDQIADRSAELRQALQECEPPTASRVDFLGPLPSDCVALPAPRAIPPQAAPAPASHGSAPQDADHSGDSTATDESDKAAAEEIADPPVDERADAADPPSGEGSHDGEQDDPADDDDHHDSGGLLGGLGRLLGNLLGG